GGRPRADDGRKGEGTGSHRRARREGAPGRASQQVADRRHPHGRDQGARRSAAFTGQGGAGEGSAEEAVAASPLTAILYVTSVQADDADLRGVGAPRASGVSAIAWSPAFGGDGAGWGWAMAEASHWWCSAPTAWTLLW